MTTAAVLGSGTPKVLVETSRDLPLVSVSVGVRTGAMLDPPGAEGSTRLVARLLRRSAGGRSAEQNDILIESLGASLGADVSYSTVTLNGAVISRSLDRFANLLAEAVTKPGLPEDEFSRLKRETEAELTELLDDDRGLAQRWFRRKLFAGHPYARPAAGTVTSLGKIAVSTLRPIYERAFVPDNLVFAFAGDITRDRAERIAEEICAALPKTPAPADTTPDPTPLAGRRLVFVDKPERTQTQILIGGLGSHPSDPDHFALAVANTAFGGTFTARLMQEVRVKRGWSYGAYSSLPYDRRRQSFSMWTFPKASDAAECIALELGMLKDLREKGLSKAELSWSKRYLLRSHAFAVDTAAKRVGLALDTELYGLPAGYYERYLEHIKSVTLEQANEALRSRLPDEDLLVAVVGTESAIGDAVRAAIPGLGSSEVVRFDSE
jgi:zinc protease